MLTPSQRIAFFVLARSAHLSEAPQEPFDEWRKAEMKNAGQPPSVKDVDPVLGYESIMLHFAVLANDLGAIGYWTSCRERRLRWVLSGMEKDLEYLRQSPVDNAYVFGIYRRADMMPKDFTDATAESLSLLVAMLDTHIRRTAKKSGIPLSALPTAGRPWHFRGKDAAAFADYIQNLSVSNGLQNPA